MMTVFVVALAIIVSYLVGSIPTGFIMTKLTKGVDIREHGSANVGATNVYRVAGKIPGYITLLLDMLKGVMVVTLVTDFSYPYVECLDYDFYRCLLALVVIAGHIWTVFLRFKGGKGVATTIGVLAVVAPKVLLISLGVWITVFAFTSYVSLASLFFAVALPLFSAILSQPIYLVLLNVAICLITTYRHKDNIRRLLRGEESKTLLFKKNT